VQVIGKWGKPVWITWENQRRSVELAECFGCHLFIITPCRLFSRNRLLRYLESAFQTLWVLLKAKPRVVFVQNPSMVLTLLSIPLSKILRFFLVVDRHTNFKLEQITTPSLFWRLFVFISRLTVKYSDLTIVTNDFLAELVEQYGGRSYVLQDKIPDMSLAVFKQLRGKQNIVFVSTFSADEPLDEVIRAAQLIDKEVIIYVTGKPTQKYVSMSKEPDFPVNIVFTGFLTEADYQSLLLSADVLLVLTINEHTLTCGTYEGIALGKCQVISDTRALREYFTRGMVYVDPLAESIAAGMTKALEEKTFLENEVKLLKKELTLNWERQFNLLRDELAAFSPEERP